MYSCDILAICWLAKLSLHLPLSFNSQSTDITQNRVRHFSKQKSTKATDTPFINNHFSCHLAPNSDQLVPIGVFWDIENCSVPRGKSALSLVQRIRDEFFNNHKEVEFMCVCDIHKENKDVIHELILAQVKIVAFCIAVYIKCKRNHFQNVYILKVNETLITCILRYNYGVNFHSLTGDGCTY